MTCMHVTAALCDSRNRGESGPEVSGEVPSTWGHCGELLLVAMAVQCRNVRWSARLPRFWILDLDLNVPKGESITRQLVLVAAAPSVNTAHQISNYTISLLPPQLRWLKRGLCSIAVPCRL